MIGLKKIRSESDSRAYARGSQLYKIGGIMDIQYVKEKDWIKVYAQVEG